jgi:hypothetical protein
MGIPLREELLQVKNGTLLPFNGYNTDVAEGAASIACNVFNFGGTEYRNDRLIRMVQVPVSRELFISSIQVFSYRTSGPSSPFAGWANNPADNQILVDYLPLYLCQNPLYATTGAGTLADPRRIAISSGRIPSFEIRFNDGYYSPEFEFPYWMDANDTLYVYADNSFPNPVTAVYESFTFYTRVTGVLVTKSRVS